jgi:hypothetical protein
VLVWPNRAQVDDALRRWAAAAADSLPELRRLGYFGSYARGEWGVGSDLDVVAIVAAADTPSTARASSWPLFELPVPADLLIYTEEEWAAMQRRPNRLARTLARETVWVFP